MPHHDVTVVPAGDELPLPSGFCPDPGPDGEQEFRCGEALVEDDQLVLLFAGAELRIPLVEIAAYAVQYVDSDGDYVPPRDVRSGEVMV